ncbi:MAG: efflux RND transporter permease subunit [Pirellulaceae bacterium]
MGTELTDLFITLHPREQWTHAETQEELTVAIQEELRDLPGPRLAMSQPIEMRMNEMVSGVRSDVAAILYGDDLDLMVEKGSEIERALKSIPGAEDVKVEQVSGQPLLEIRIKQDEIARYGIPASTVMNLVRSLGTHNVGEVYEGQLRFPLIIRLPEKARANPEAIKQILVATSTGQRIPLSRLATIEKVDGPNTIKRDCVSDGSQSSRTCADETWAALLLKRGESLPRKSNCHRAVTASSGVGNLKTCNVLSCV